MTYDRGITVVIPCLNEAESIAQAVAKALAGISRTGCRAEVLVVDNGSQDGSAEIARRAGARVLHEPHRGYGSALRAGFARASHDIIVMGDADLTYDFERLDVLVQPLLDGQADLVMGNRMRSIKPGAMPWLHRYIGNPLLSMILRIMFRNHSVHDAHCGMRAITKSAYESLRCVTTGMEFASEMVIRAIRCRLRIMERDIEYHPRIGESKLRSFKDGWRHLRFMILHSPTMLLLLPGLIFWFAGLAISLPLAFGPIIINQRVVDIHCMLLGGVLNLISMQIITIGLLAKAYGHLSGLQEDSMIAWLYRWFTFEKACLLALLLLMLGMMVVLWV
ncbi:MAG: glycosyltransferase family 2 protein, partial [Lentisphaerae bacterium]|nr:glycosyltransferase family 2 protein [Lentisphaerota bacterium]